MPDVVSLPHSGGQWMASAGPVAPPRVEKCEGEGCDEVINGFIAAQRAGDRGGLIVARARVVRHIDAAHGEAKWPGGTGG